MLASGGNQEVIRTGGARHGHPAVLYPTDREDSRSGWLAGEPDLEIVAEVGVDVGFLHRVDELHRGR